MKTKKHKIALYIVGQWRGASENCSKYINDLLNLMSDEYEVYTFIHVWDFYDPKEQIFHAIKPDSNISDKYLVWDYYTKQFNQSEIDNIRNLYPNVVYFETDSQSVNHSIQKIGLPLSLSSFPQFYCAYKCNQNRQIYENMNGMRFDIIFKLRPDTIFWSPNPDKLLNSMINTIKNDKTIVYSKYRNDLENIKKESRNLVWDYYTLSSPYGMDCMMEWVEDNLNNIDSTQKLWATDYILKHNLNPNPNNLGIDFNGENIIIREILKYFDLSKILQSEHKRHTKITKEVIKNYIKVEWIIMDVLYSKMVNSLHLIEGLVMGNSQVGINLKNIDIKKLFLEFYDIDNLYLNLCGDKINEKNKTLHFDDESIKAFTEHILNRKDEFESMVTEKIYNELYIKV